MKIDFPTQTIFYTIENAIKQYRKMGQKNIAKAIKDITIDQALVLILLQKNPEYSQVEIAEILFKDYASITRMIALMVSNGYLKKTSHKIDKRRTTLRVTKKGRERIELLKPLIKSNREKALRGIDKTEEEQLHRTLQKMIYNCS